MTPQNWTSQCLVEYLAWSTEYQVHCMCCFGEWFTSTLGTCASSSTTTHVVQAWWGITSFPPPVRQHLNQTFGEEWIWGEGSVNWPTGSPDNALDFLAVGTPKNLGVFGAIQWLRDITATSTKCLSGDLSETKNFRKCAHLCATKSWKLCWNAWEPHRPSAVEITRTSPLSQQTLVSGHVLTGTLVHLSEYYILLKYVTLF
jgi:hypothetical protein